VRRRKERGSKNGISAVRGGDASPENRRGFEKEFSAEETGGADKRGAKKKKKKKKKRKNKKKNKKKQKTTKQKKAPLSSRVKRSLDHHRKERKKDLWIRVSRGLYFPSGRRCQNL